MSASSAEYAYGCGSLMLGVTGKIELTARTQLFERPTYEELSKRSWHVLVLRHSLELPDELDLRCRTLLPENEIRRLDAIPNAVGRSSFLLGRALLRLAVESTLGLPARDVPLIRSDHGKPRLGDEVRRPLFFNLSRCRTLVSLALSTHGEVGADVEDVERQCSRLPTRILRPEEIELLEALAEPERTASFMQLWTIKEACVKARGGRLADAAGVTASLGASGSDGDVTWWAVRVPGRVRCSVALRGSHHIDYGSVGEVDVTDLFA